ncbi:MAG TPA: sugar transferase [Terriglobales bacterium]|nr:sugar transferase [Terriglobales bacterium]
MGTIMNLSEDPASSIANRQIAVQVVRRSDVRLAIKAVFDRIIGLAGSIVTLFFIPFVALLLKFEDGGPIFHRREFVDSDGQLRHYLKFRTMLVNADQILRDNPALKKQFDHKYKLPDDPRILRFGRFLRKYSIDEFPQFFSVLTGRLTFVGPRVISQEETPRYGKLLPKLLSVKPGVTGYWQVMGRQKTTYAERIKMDMFYIDHWSLGLDFIIMAKTVWKVLRADGAC